jgi:hypothetical protein
MEIVLGKHIAVSDIPGLLENKNKVNNFVFILYAF